MGPFSAKHQRLLHCLTPSPSQNCPQHGVRLLILSTVIFQLHSQCLHSWSLWDASPRDLVPSPTSSATPCTPLVFLCGEPANILLQYAPTPHLMATLDVAYATRIILTCISICVAMVGLHTASTNATKAQFTHRKQLRRRGEKGVSIHSNNAMARHEPDEEALEHLHVKQVLDLFAWNIGVVDARWYVKPRSTCWFEEYFSAWPALSQGGGGYNGRIPR